jgi:hypothetical protein
MSGRRRCQRENSGDRRPILGIEAGAQLGGLRSPVRTQAQIALAPALPEKPCRQR